MIARTIFITLFICLFGTIPIAGQSLKDIKVNSAKSALEQLYADSTIQVNYVYENQKKEKEPVYIINRIAYENGSILSSFDAKAVEKVDVFKRDTIIGGKEYYGIFFVILKNKDYQPLPITLDSLKNKYTNIKSEPAIYCIDNNLIKENSKEYLVDEKYVRRIVVDKMTNPKDSSDLVILKVLTKKKD